MVMTLLNDILPFQIFSFVLVLVRVSGMVMLMPGYGEKSVPVRVKVGLSVAITVILWPIAQDVLPAIPKNVPGLAAIVLGEFIVGAAIGFALRFVIIALTVTGMIFAMQTGLGFAQSFDPAQGSQSAVVASLLSLIGITLIMVTDLHLMLIEIIFDSYEIFPPGQPLPVGDLTQAVVGIFVDSFNLGIQLAGPAIAFALMFYLGLGIISRLTPQIQIFFVAMPVQIYVGLVMLAVILPSMMLWYLEHVERQFSIFLR
jgi:flagellar biosynthetic protein FliR